LIRMNLASALGHRLSSRSAARNGAQGARGRRDAERMNSPPTSVRGCTAWAGTGRFERTKPLACSAGSDAQLQRVGEEGELYMSGRPLRVQPRNGSTQ
jgi:hypothetical protein